MRRLFRTAMLASLALCGCAAVLAIDDIPTPDAADGGLPDGSTSGSIDAPTTGDERSTADAPLPPTPIDSGTDAGDAGPTILVLTTGSTFDPSAVYWDGFSHVLYVADNALPPTSEGPDSGTLWSWTEDGGTFMRVITVPLALNGERFGQVLRQSDDKLLLPEHAGANGHLYFYDPTPPTALKSLLSGSAFFGAGENAGIYVTSHTSTGWKLEAIDEQNDKAVSPLTIPDASIGFVTRTSRTFLPSYYVATATGQILEYANGSTTGTAVATIPMSAPGYMVDGPDGSVIVSSPGAIYLVTLQGSSQARSLTPDAGPSAIGAVAYDAEKGRLFVPLSGGNGAGGRVLVVPIGDP